MLTSLYLSLRLLLLLLLCLRGIPDSYLYFYPQQHQHECSYPQITVKYKTKNCLIYTKLGRNEHTLQKVYLINKIFHSIPFLISTKRNISKFNCNFDIHEVFKICFKVTIDTSVQWLQLTI